MTIAVKKESNHLIDLDNKKELLKRTICKDATDDEVELFSHVCKRAGLDPFIKQIHFVKRNSKNGPVVSFQTAIDALD